MQYPVAAIVLCTLLLASCTSTRPELQVQYNSGQISKTAILNQRLPSTVRAIQYNAVDSPSGDTIAILTQSDYRIVSASNYTTLSHVSTANLGLSPQLIYTAPTNPLEILMGGSGFGAVGLLDNFGRPLWKFQPNAKVIPDKMITADLDGDQQLEFYVIQNSDGLYQLNRFGEINWHVAPTKGISDIAIVDNKLFAANPADKEILEIDSNGDITNRLQLKRKLRTINSVQWPTEHGWITHLSTNHISLLDLEGDITFEFSVKQFPQYHSPQALAVHFEPGRPPYLAVLAHSRSSVGRSLLSIFSPTHQLIYQEILPSSRGFCANPSNRETGDTLLVGNGYEGVFEYTLNDVGSEAVHTALSDY